MPDMLFDAAVTIARSIRIPDDLNVCVEGDNTRQIRVTSLEERIFYQQDVRGWDYCVYLFGPRVTKAGRDHTKEVGGRLYIDRNPAFSWGRWAPPKDIPAALRRYLVGEDALRALVGTLPDSLTAPED